MADGAGVHDELVLIVEDDPSIAELVQFVLEDEFGVHALIAEDGERALALAREFHPLLVLLDVNLPKLSGLEVARLLKADPSTRSLSLVAITSTSETETRRAGCSDYLTKPFDLDDLTDLVGKYLGFPLTVREVADLSDALARLLELKASAVAWAVRNRDEAAALRAIASRTHLRSRAALQRSARLVQVARDRHRLAA